MTEDEARGHAGQLIVDLVSEVIAQVNADLLANRLGEGVGSEDHQMVIDALNAATATVGVSW